MRVDALVNEFQIEAFYRHFPLHPETPAEGLTLEQLFAGRGMDVAAAQRRIASLMEQEGLPYGERTMTYNSRLAQELACWAVERPEGNAIHVALFQAYFVNNVNLASIPNLVAAAKSVGLPATEAERVLTDRTHRQRVDADWNRARALGLTGVPSFILNGRGVVGAQPLDVLREFLESSGVPRREG